MDGLGSRVRHRGTRGVSVVDALMVYIKKAGQVSLFNPPQKKTGGCIYSGSRWGVVAPRGGVSPVLVIHGQT